MTQSLSFHSIPQKILVTIATEINGEPQNTNQFFIEPQSADQFGISLKIDKGLKAGYPIRLHLVPANPQEGTLTMATPDDSPFAMEVGCNPPSQVHIHRKFEDGDTHITCLIPVSSSEEQFDLEHRRQRIWDIASEIVDDTENDEATLDDQLWATYYGGLMEEHHVLSLDYTPGVRENAIHLHSIKVMQRHFLPA